MRNIGTIIGSTFWKAERSMRIMQVPSAFFGTSPQGVQQDRPDRQRNEMGIEHRNHQHIAKWSFLVFPPYPTIQCNTGEYVWPIIPMFVPLPKKISWLGDNPICKRATFLRGVLMVDPCH